MLKSVAPFSLKLLAAAIVITLTACGTVERYPSSWPNLPSQADSCVDISGVYEQLGEGSVGSERFLLSDFLIAGIPFRESRSGGSATVRNDDTARINWTPAGVTIDIGESGKEVFHRSYPSTDSRVTCEMGFTTITQEKSDSGNGAFYSTKIIVRMTRGDGYLLVSGRREEKGVSFYPFIIPFPYSDNSERWARYKLLERIEEGPSSK